VVEIAENGTRHRSEGGYVRDDRERLQIMARIAHDWYLNNRRTLQVNFAGISGTFDVGRLITTIDIGSTVQEVNTVITRTRLDLERGTTEFETQFIELDLPAIT